MFAFLLFVIHDRADLGAAEQKASGLRAQFVDRLGLKVEYLDMREAVSVSIASAAASRASSSSMRIVLKAFGGNLTMLEKADAQQATHDTQKANGNAPAELDDEIPH